MIYYDVHKLIVDLIFGLVSFRSLWRGEVNFFRSSCFVVFFTCSIVNINVPVLQVSVAQLKQTFTAAINYSLIVRRNHNNAYVSPVNNGQFNV